jgi:hypothetical protein
VQQLYGEEIDDERKAMPEFDHLRDWCISGFPKHQCEQKLMKMMCIQHGMSFSFFPLALISVLHHCAAYVRYGCCTSL